MYIALGKKLITKLKKIIMQQDKKYYDDFFTKYSVNVHDNSVRFNAVAKLLSGKVLDIACGTGTLANYYTGDYTGVDFSDVAIYKACGVRRKGARFIVADFAKDAFVQKEKYDCAYLGEFLEHIEREEIVFENLFDLLKPDGKIIVSVPNGNRVPDESHCRTFTVPEIRRAYSRYGKITFHNWSGFKNRILFTIELGKKNKNEMSLVMIVKDEEKGLEKAVMSALPIVDRVVISVDSKSRDKTAEIAKMYADELKTHEWENDFSKARNFAQANVKSRWILFLDGHEYIESYGDYERKIKLDIEGIFVTVRMESGLTFLFPRIYRSYIKFKNAVHNVNECKTRRCSPKFVIVHDRLAGQTEKSTERRNEQREGMLPQEMKNQIKESPKNARPHFHLANFYMMRQKISLALRHYKKAIKFGKSADEKYLCLINIGLIHQVKGHWLRALWKFKKADELIPGRWESARVIGGFYYLHKHYKKAVDYLVNALSQNKRRYSYEPFTQNKAEIWDMIGHCFAKLDQNAQAVIAWKRAVELEKDERRKKLFRQKIDLVNTLLPRKIPVKSK